MRRPEKKFILINSPEVESSRTHFKVLRLGLEASSPRKLPCPRLEDSTIFEPLKFRWKTPETLLKICNDLFLVSSSRDRQKKNFEDLFRLKKIFEDLFFLRTLASVSLVLGLEIFLCPWPQNFFVSLASKFFCVLGFEPCVLDSTSAIHVT